MGSSPPISMRVAPAITVICGGSSPSLAASYPAIAARDRKQARDSLGTGFRIMRLLHPPHAIDALEHARRTGPTVDFQVRHAGRIERRHRLRCKPALAHKFRVHRGAKRDGGNGENQ